MVAIVIVGILAMVFLFGSKSAGNVGDTQELEDTVVPSGNPDTSGTANDAEVRNAYLNNITPVLTWLNKMSNANKKYIARAQVMTDTRRKDFNCWVKPFLNPQSISLLLQRHAAHYYISVADLYVIRDDVQRGLDEAVAQENRSNEQSRAEFQSIRTEREACTTVLNEFNNVDQQLIEFYTMHQMNYVPQILTNSEICSNWNTGT